MEIAEVFTLRDAASDAEYLLVKFEQGQKKYLRRVSVSVNFTTGLGKPWSLRTGEWSG
jgi:hypothetical protein